jgi:serine/threonine protein kinase
MTTDSYQSDQAQGITGNKKAGRVLEISFTENYGKFNKVLHYNDTNTVELYKRKVPLLDPTSPEKFSQSHLLGIPRHISASNTIKELYAVKVFRHTKTTLSLDLQNQGLTISLSHPNIVPIVNILYNRQGNLCLVMPYYAGGDLHSFLSRRKPREKPSTEELDCLAIQILRAVAFLHGRNIAHGDIRPEHILLTARGAVKVGGFGQDEDAIRELATLSQSGDLTSSFSETNPDSAPDSEYKPILCIRRTVSDPSIPYLPPERFPGRGSLPQTYAHQDISNFRAGDIWACGIICMLLRSGQLPWHSSQTVDPDESFADYLLCRKEANGYSPIQTLEEHYRNVVYAMLHPDMEARITAAEVLRSEWALESATCEVGEMGL